MGQTKHPLFPRTVDAQVADLNTKTKYLEANKTRLNIPQTEITALRTQMDKLNELHAIASDKDNRSKIDVANRDNFIDISHLLMRKTIDFYVDKSPNATPVDYEALNIPSSGPFHPLSPPEDVPGIRNINSHDLSVNFSFFDNKANKRGKPEGVQSFEMYYKVGGEPPTDIEEMTERKIFTASPIHLPFDFKDEFVVLYFAGRWVGTRGDYGPWSEIHKIVIAR